MAVASASNSLYKTPNASSFRFSNLSGAVYNGRANVVFTPDGNSVVSPVGNRVSVFDLVKYVPHLPTVSEAWAQRCGGFDEGEEVELAERAGGAVRAHQNVVADLLYPTATSPEHSPSKTARISPVSLFLPTRQSSSA
jgi:hypothetical protein